MSDVYTLAEASRFLGQDVSAVLKLVETGALPHQQGQNGEVFVSGRDLTRFAVANFGKSA